MSDSIEIGWLGPTHNHWDWIIGHFRQVTFLTERNVEDWIVSKSQAAQLGHANSTPVLLAAIESRFEPLMDVVRGFEKNLAPITSHASSMPWCLLLGDDWVGHRRTFPLPESIQTFYWYEWYDRVLPWLVDQSHASLATSADDSAPSTNKRKLSPRVQRLIDASLSMDSRLSCSIKAQNSIKMAIIVTETATTRQLWCDALSRQGIQCVATTPENLEWWATPDIIVVDIEFEPWIVRVSNLIGENGDARGNLVRRLAEQFPMATVIAVDAFPRWETWKTLKDCGADLIVAKPFQLPGILDTLHHCETGPFANTLLP